MAQWVKQGLLLGALLLLSAGVLAADACATSCTPCKNNGDCKAAAGCQDCACKPNLVPGGPAQVCMCPGGPTLKDCMSNNVAKAQATAAQATAGKPVAARLNCVVPPKGSTRRVPCEETKKAPEVTAPATTAPVTQAPLTAPAAPLLAKPAVAAPGTNTPVATAPVTGTTVAATAPVTPPPSDKSGARVG